MKIKKIKKTKILHLSVYEDGRHITTGFAREGDKQYSRVSVFESLTAFVNLLQEFGDLPLGTKLKVTIENVK